MEISKEKLQLMIQEYRQKAEESKQLSYANEGAAQAIEMLLAELEEGEVKTPPLPE